MKVLVIPDIHLKPYMIEDARNILDTTPDIDGIVFLGDVVDDFGEQRNIKLYEETLNALISFCKGYKESHSVYFCIGNHDISYMWHKWQSGTSDSIQVEKLIREKLRVLKHLLGENMNFVNKVDNILFSHAGISIPFIYFNNLDDKIVEWYSNVLSNPDKTYKIPNIDINYIVDRINKCRSKELWDDISPIWIRVEDDRYTKFLLPNTYQIVGHTPQRHVFKLNNDKNNSTMVICDTHSTHRNKSKYGDCSYVVADTIDKTYQIIEQPCKTLTN